MLDKLEPYKGIAGTYEEIRPSYPKQLIEDIIFKTGVEISDKLLELGAGTGKATIHFAEKGFYVHAVEIGEDMADILKKKCSVYKKVTIDVKSFEQWKSNGGIYDMIYCAQAFHWFDPTLKYKKCHSLLKDKGYLVLFWYNPSEDSSPEAQERQKKINDIVDRYIDNYYVKAETVQRREHDGVYKEDERFKEIENSGLFTVTDKLEYIQETRNDADKYIKTMLSIPAFAAILDGLDEKNIEEMTDEIRSVIDAYGGYVSTYLNYSLYIASKKEHS